MVNSAPVMLAARLLARNSTRSATSPASVIRPVLIPMLCGTTSSSACWAVTPAPAATACAMPSGPVQNGVRTGPGELPPTLILAAERDAATPYKGALELQRRLAGSVLVTERKAGTHGIAGGGNACVHSYVEEYLLHGKAPVRRAECAPHAEPDPVSKEPADKRLDLQRRLKPVPHF